VDLAFSSHARFEKRAGFAQCACVQNRVVCHSQGLGLLCSVHHSPTLQPSTQTRKPIIFKQNFVTFASSQHTTRNVGGVHNMMVAFWLHCERTGRVGAALYASNARNAFIACSKCEKRVEHKQQAINAFFVVSMQ
jgi:hypothetical protein